MTPKQSAYLTLHKASGIEVGDKVRVLRKAEPGELGWNQTTWTNSMTDRVGKICNVEGDDGTYGFICSGWNFPFFVLELVEKGGPPMTIDVNGIGGRPVKFLPGHILVGCAEIPNATVRQIAERLVDEWRYFQRTNTDSFDIRKVRGGEDALWWCNYRNS